MTQACVCESILPHLITNRVAILRLRLSANLFSTQWSLFFFCICSLIKVISRMPEPLPRIIPCQDAGNGMVYCNIGV